MRHNPGVAIRLLTWAFALCLAVVPAAASSVAKSNAARGYVLPLKLSANKRYLVDQNGKPFLIVGDSPQALIGNLSPHEAETYLADRQKAGFNAIWVNLLCDSYTGCNSDGTTFDGIAPFTTAGNLATPNPDYFMRVATMIQLAAKHGIVVFLDPIETGGWLDVLRNNGVTKDKAYGKYLGNRYKKFSNIVWFSGNDFQSWSDASDDADVLAVANGIRETDPKALQTSELSYLESGSLDDSRWRGVLSLDGAYTYYATYDEVLRQYAKSPHLPVFMEEAGYEDEQNSGFISPGTPQTLRRQEYWTALSGATGQFYGNHYIWPFSSGWQQHLDTPGSKQFGYLVRLLEGLPWYQLVPDIHHRVVTAGYGTYDGTANVLGSDYVTTAVTPSGKLALAYLPAGRTVTVNMSRFAGQVRIRWFDPKTGSYRTSAARSHANNGTARLTAPSTSDWLLVLTAP
jgi:Protein of unknown function (DUF4038)/Putative collagen-binding domain of a collagenase